MIGVKPYIFFSGDCEEAMNFYAECTGGQMLGLQRYGDTPMAGDGTNGQLVMHCAIKIGETLIMAADNCMAERRITMGDNISLALGVDTVDETERIFEKMSDGGVVTMPLQETYWAARFGMLRDKYGINWMFNCEKPHGETHDEN